MRDFIRRLRNRQADGCSWDGQTVEVAKITAPAGSYAYRWAEQNGKLAGE